MSSRLKLGNMSYNPDVLSCLANLSNDEVFTSPQLANQVLDLLPADIWHDSSITFLDPFTKTGVFLREITKRLLVGLEDEFPDLQERINHILNYQVWGIAITELTALLARRTLYCSKKANGEYSIEPLFDDANGHIHYRAIEHTWAGNNCVYCGASKEQYDRGSDLESYTYEFIHTFNPERIYNDMQFDVIVGNPPYQLSDGGYGKSAAPIYHKFVEQAEKLNPRYLSMIIPSRWFGGGKGLNSFRSSMLADKRIRQLVDFENANECFPGVDLAGGVCYFLWDRDNPGSCNVINVINGKEHESVRGLDEFTIFIRNSRAVPVVRKVVSRHESMMNTQVSSRKPFGLATNVRPRQQGDLILHWQNGEGRFPSAEVTNGREWINKYKVIAAYSAYDHAGSPDKNGMRKVFTKIHILPPKVICNETYLVVGAFDSEREAENLRNYMETRFFRFLVSQFMFSQHITREAYAFVPIQDCTQEWTDEKLYEKYGITKEEQLFIESCIRPMNGDNDA
ncbi:Eco57I restriction-modification methylase domain-containing protein [Bifidobacterium sp.]|jgi:site-specific DNA-methyltransferase (adenine-specific)|uniref:Eco57I restriction-modification methylase domain-containing protein n=1 Tax=Bifidobacterium sp. TaxID=41200 RepID=UPI0025C471A5|nr:Eco57I restriction-modification methylase domain-containing protein [Bifidobacterium sp.]MCI1636110.1 Eco57I restriction-modification methylase domain-containing protein [Bifidobacterium sp.]